MRNSMSTLIAAVLAISTLCLTQTASAQLLEEDPCADVLVMEVSRPGCVIYNETTQIGLILETMGELDDYGTALVTMERELLDQREALDEYEGNSSRSRQNARRIEEIDAQLAELVILSGRLGSVESMLDDHNIALVSIQNLLTEQIGPSVIQNRLAVSELRDAIEAERIRNDEQDALIAAGQTHDAEQDGRLDDLEANDQAQDVVITELQDRKPIRFAFGGGVFAGSGVETSVLGQAGFDVDLGANVRVLALFNVGTNMDNLVLGGQLGVAYSIDRVSLGAFVMVNRDLGSNAPGAHTMSVLVGPSLEYAIGGDQGRFALFTEGGYMTSDVDGEPREGGGVLAGPRFRF